MQKRSILIVDDSALAARHLQNILGTEKYDHTIISTVIDSNTMSEIEKINPDLIILDLILKCDPNIDIKNGFDILSRLMGNPDTKQIPVIIVSGLSDVESEKRGLELGAVDFISKPYEAYKVQLRVDLQIRMLEYLHKVIELSTTDQLTDLPNRRSFDERINIEWNRAKRGQLPTCVLILDIDNFKVYNDTEGHLQGDVALKHVAQILKKRLKRATDFVSRWGGEEFVVLLSETHRTGALLVAEEVRRAIENSVVLTADGRETRVTVSIGVNSTIPKSDCTIDDFLVEADNALYKAKEEGRNRVVSAKSEEDDEA